MTETPTAPKAGKTLLLEGARAVVTLDDGGTVLEGGDVLIQGPEILRIGTSLRTGGMTEPDRVIDCSGTILLPGLVNTHHHLFQTLFRAIPEIQDAPLFPWLLHLYELWRGLDEETVYVSAKVGLAELLLTGCTTTTDQFYPFPRGTRADLIGLTVRAARELGIRFHPSRGSMSLGKSKGGLPPDALTQGEDEILEDSERVASRYHDPSPFSMCRVVLAPCSPFSVTPSLLERTADLGRRKGLRLHTHLAETLDEEKFCLDTFGKRPLAFLQDRGWTGPDVWFAHGIHFTDDEIASLAASGTGVAHCPTSNLRLGSGIAPVRKMLDAGVPLGLAVDGSASNDSSDMLGEVRTALLVHRIASHVGAMPARTVLEMATRGGAKLLGRTELGKLQPGMAADIIGIDTRRVGFAGALHDPVAAVVFAGDCHIVDLNVVNGNVVVEGGRLTATDERALVEEANRVAARFQGSKKEETG
ncbi:MAG: 8-oxoguanine deaminase [Planctomycetota bacterium]|jgi:cytosine/adenosine deaminase-related metal-dependent hydrolase